MKAAEVDPGDVFKILLTTDIHLGYTGLNPIRENDTFTTFEEILQIAQREKVDFILLGGDLFHDARPSTYCLNRCTELIRQYCLGDWPVQMEFLSDPAINFSHKNRSSSTVNYEDPNLNVSIPIFSIHGNHDDPSGKQQISAINLMATMGFINYFGRWDSLTEVEVSPILLKKGQSHLALYGLSHIRDARLARLFLDKKVTIKIPPNVSNWFNMLVLHQNRADRGIKNFISESFIPDFFQLVMWGHEHDCHITPTALGAHSGAYITQPGSTVATSLSEGEALPKKVGILLVHGTQFSLEEVELRTVRPFVYRQMLLEAPPSTAASAGEDDDATAKVSHAQKAEAKVKLVVEEMIQEADEMDRFEHMLPLIRLVVRYEDERQVFNVIRFGQSFADTVANSRDMVKFVCTRKPNREVKFNVHLDDEDDLDVEEVSRVEDLLPKYFADEKNKLSLLSLSGLSIAVRRYVKGGDSDAPSYLINTVAEQTMAKLMETKPEEGATDDFLENLRVIAERNPQEVHKLLNDPKRVKKKAVLDVSVMTVDSDDDEEDVITTPSRPAKGPGSRGGRGSKGSRRSRGGRGKGPK